LGDGLAPFESKSTSFSPCLVRLRFITPDHEPETSPWSPFARVNEPLMSLYEPEK